MSSSCDRFNGDLLIAKVTKVAKVHLLEFWWVSGRNHKVLILQESTRKFLVFLVKFRK